VLTAMKRPSDTGLFTEIIREAQNIAEDFEIRTSFIVGFPGEEQSDFDMLKDFVVANRIDKLALFRYSHEVGTTAGDKLTENVTDAVKYERMNELRELHLNLRKEYALGLIGRRERMLVDEITPASGSTSNEVTLRRAHDAPESDEIVTVTQSATSPLKIGDMPLVELKAYTEYSFLGEVVAAS